MKLTKQDLFATPTDFKVIEAHIMRMPKECRAEALVAVGMMWNLAVSISQQENKDEH